MLCRVWSAGNKRKRHLATTIMVATTRQNRNINQGRRNCPKISPDRHIRFFVSSKFKDHSDKTISVPHFTSYKLLPGVHFLENSGQRKLLESSGFC